ncbi:NmrA family NAD(P)-binding protein [Nonomuraea sp. NPDC048826]|uniref:NmrA family NAD(P)-binding protein n=1 Tax=Nonomuraea sp. NPDC048826 TaxID=3364347 RepID=UPI0037151E96
MAPATVLVMGATGAIGSALVDKLLPDHRKGLLRLVVTTRRPDAADRLRKEGVDVRRLDLDEAETGGLQAVRPAFAGVDRLMLITGYDVRMLAQSKAAVDAAKAEGVSYVTHVGVSATEDTTIVHFAWHQLVEAYIERSSLRYTHLRPAAFMQNLRLSVTAPGVLRHFVGEARPNWVDVTDIAEVAATVLCDPEPHAGRAYDLASESASLREITELLGKATGRPWRYEPAEPQAFYESMVAAGADPVYMACVRNVFERTRNGSLDEPDDIFTTIEAVTGRPATSMQEFVRRNHDLFSG